MIFLSYIPKLPRNLILQKFRKFSIANSSRIATEKEKCQVLIVGGGSGGCTMAAKLCRKLGNGKVTVLDSADLHFYQPMFTLIGGGMKNLSQSCKRMENVLPTNAKWIKEKAVEFNPANCTVLTNCGREISYDIMILALGLELHYDKIPGLLDALSIPNGKVSSIFSEYYVERTWNSFQQFEEGNAIFNFPASVIKCPGAPQKICYIFDHYLRKTNKRDRANITYNTSLPVIFGVKHYADALWKVVKKRNINVNLKSNLIKINPDSNIATFENLDCPSDKTEYEYSLLHVVPPMSTPKEIHNCKELVDDKGFVDVNPNFLQHKKYENIFSIGDCSSTPNSKTIAAVAAQSPVVLGAILDTLKGKKYGGHYYCGYASCPLVTGYNSCILAEFDYNLQPLETFPIPQDKERFSMFFMKKELMPILYWNFMLNGYWNGPDKLRKLCKPFKND